MLKGIIMYLKSLVVLLILILGFSVESKAQTTVNSSNALMAAVNNGAVGSTILIKPGTYVLGGPLKPKDGMTIKGAGRDNTTLKAASNWVPNLDSLPDGDTKARYNANGYLFFVGGSDNVTLQDMTITGAKLHGAVYAKYSKGLNLLNLTIKDFRWAGMRTYATDKINAQNNIMINAGGKKGTTGAAFYFNHGQNHVFNNNKIYKTADYNNNFYGFKATNSKYVKITNNDVGVNFSIEFAHQHAQNVEISHNRLTGTVSIPKHAGGSKPKDTGVTFDIHHNWFQKSYSLEWPRNGVLVHDNLFDFDIKDNGGNLISNFAGTKASGSAKMYNNLIRNPGRGIYWSKGAYNNFSFYNNHVKSASYKQDWGRRLPFFELSSKTDFSTITIKNNIFEIEPGNERPLMHGKESYQATIKNNVLGKITDQSQYKNPATKEAKGLLNPLNFFVGVDKQYKVDNWNVCQTVGTAATKTPLCKGNKIVIEKPTAKTKQAEPHTKTQPTIQPTIKAEKSTPVTPSSPAPKQKNIKSSVFEAESLEHRYRKAGTKSDATASGGRYFQISHGSGYVAYKATENLSDLKNIVVRAAGEMCEGSPRMRVEYGYSKRKEFTVDNDISDWKEYTIPTLLLNKGDVIKIVFLEDRYIRGRCDRNLLVDSIKLEFRETAESTTQDKTVLEAENLKRYRSTGIKNDPNASNNKYFQISHRSGYVSYKLTNDMPNVKKLTVRAYGTECNGPAKMKLEYGRNSDKNFVVANEKNGWKDYTVSTGSLKNNDEIKVIFTNDRYVKNKCDRNLMVDAIILE